MFRLLLLFATCGTLGLAQADTLAFKQALDLARQVAPDVTVIDEYVDATRANAIAAGRLPDPRLIVGVDNVPVDGMNAWSLSRDFMTMRKVGVMQELPNRAKRQAARDNANASMAEAEAQRHLRLLQIQRDTALAWLNRFYLERGLALLDALDRENKLLLDTVQAQLAAGRGTPAELTDAEQEAAALLDRRDEFNSEIIQSKAALQRYVGFAADEPLAGQPPSLAIDADALRSHIATQPELLIYDPKIEGAQAQVRAAKAAKHPDWSIELGYANRGAASDMASLQFSIGLPLFTKSRQDPQIADRQHQLNRLVAERDTMLRDQQRQLEMELAQYTALSTQLERMRLTRIPLARQKVEYQLADYRGGKITLAQLLAARRELINMQIKQLELESQHAAVAARLYFIYGEGGQ